MSHIDTNNTIEPDPTREMRASWGELIASCEHAGLGRVSLSTNVDRAISIDFEHTLSWSWGLTVREAACAGWLEVRGFGERWTDLKALRAYLVERWIEVTARRAA